MVRALLAGASSDSEHWFFKIWLCRLTFTISRTSGFSARSFPIHVIRESNVSSAPPQLTISASFLTSHFILLITSVNYVSQAILATKHSTCQTLPYSDCYTAACPGSCFVSTGLL